MIFAAGARRGRRAGAGVGPAQVAGWLAGTCHGACYFLALWTGSPRAVVIMSAGGGRQHERNMTASSREGKRQARMLPGDSFAGWLLWKVCGRP